MKTANEGLSFSKEISKKYFKFLQITASYKIPSNVDQVSKMQQLQLEHFSDPQILYKLKYFILTKVENCFEKSLMLFG